MMRNATWVNCSTDRETLHSLWAAGYVTWDCITQDGVMIRLMINPQK